MLHEANAAGRDCVARKAFVMRNINLSVVRSVLTTETCDMFIRSNFTWCADSDFPPFFFVDNVDFLGGNGRMNK